MKYTLLSNVQLLIMTVLIGLISATAVTVMNMYLEYRMLPVVSKTADGSCIKVVNFENGHAFGCPDVNVLLRQYRVEVISAQ